MWYYNVNFLLFIEMTRVVNLFHVTQEMSILKSMFLFQWHQHGCWIMSVIQQWSGLPFSLLLMGCTWIHTGGRYSLALRMPRDQPLVCVLVWRYNSCYSRPMLPSEKRGSLLLFTLVTNYFSSLSLTQWYTLFVLVNAQGYSAGWHKRMFDKILVGMTWHSSQSSYYLIICTIFKCFTIINKTIG